LEVIEKAIPLQSRINRRRLIEILTLAATTAYARKNCRCRGAAGLDVALVNHVSYTCPDFRSAADWYSMVFNLDRVGATTLDVALPFGKKGDKPFGHGRRCAADAAWEQQRNTSRARIKWMLTTEKGRALKWDAPTRKSRSKSQNHCDEVDL
jgi:hypothetical protein